MNIIKRASMLAGLAALAACGAQEANESGTPGGANTAEAASETPGVTHSATGTVDNISGNKVTISHEAIESVGWPPMTMPFAVSDASLVKDIKAGDRVSFAFTKSGSTATLTSVSKQ